MPDRLIRVALLGAMMVALCAPAAAFGAQATGRTVTTVTAGQVASQLAGQVKGVQLGSTGATVTLEINGVASPVRVDFGEVMKGVGSGEGGGWMTIAAIPMVGGALVKILNFLAKLGRG
ncbi:MAG: hypothetical protein Q7W16_06530 [Coriobacteriia bacterium]|nr:hypothetical protein [Coriobacteriia bacterium]